MTGSPAQRITAHYGGDWHGTHGTFRTPGHSKHDRGMSVTDEPGAPDGVLINTFNGGDPLAVKDECRSLGFIGRRDRSNVDEAERMTATFVYRNAEGRDVYRTVRKEQPGKGKRFVAERIEGGAWKSGLNRVERIPYRLPELIAADPAEPVYFVEGERKADKLAAMGFVATAIPFGCKGWRSDYAEHFAGRSVIILPDNDDEGRAFAATVERSIKAVAGRATVVELPGLPAKGDVVDWNGSADDLRTLVEAARDSAGSLKEEADTRRQLPIEWGEDLKPCLSGLWLIKKTLPQEGLALIYGHPGSGKSFLAIDMAMHVALGWDWNGAKTRRGVVVYVAAEGQRGLRNRIVAFKQHHGLSGPIPLALIPVPIDLQDPKADRAALARAVQSAAKHYGEAPALIVVDTISKTMGGGKENTDDLATYVSNCGWLASEFGCCVMPVHHRPKDAESTEPRGHGSLKGGVDTVILVEAGKPKRARITKQKDDEERDLLLFNLKPLTLGADDDGEEVTSCVVEGTPIDTNPIADPFARAVQKLPSGARLVFDQLAELLETNEVAIPSDIPDVEIDRNCVGKVASLTAWRDKSISAAGTEAGHDRDTGKKAFNRAKEKLRKDGVVRIWEEWAWITHRITGT